MLCSTLFDVQPQSPSSVQADESESFAQSPVLNAVTRRLSSLLGIAQQPQLPPASADLDDAAILREERRAQLMVREYSALPIDVQRLHMRRRDAHRTVQHSIVWRCHIGAIVRFTARQLCYR